MIMEDLEDKVDSRHSILNVDASFNQLLPEEESKEGITPLPMKASRVNPMMVNPDSLFTRGIRNDSMGTMET